MYARRRFARIASKLIGDFLILAFGHRRALRSAYDDRIILVAVHELTYDNRVHVRIAKYAVPHIVPAEQWRDNLRVWKLFWL